MKPLRFAAGLAMAVVAAGVPARAETIVVSPAGPQRSIAAAVRAAAPGSTIVIGSGTYHEPPFVVDRPLILVGDARPVIEPAGPGTLIRVTADDVVLRGLVLANVAPSHVEDRAAVRFERVRGCVVEDNEIRNAPFGIYLSEVSDCRIVRNVVHGAGRTAGPPGNAIHLWSSRQVTVIDNVVTNHRDGLYLEFVQGTTIERNRSERNRRYGLHFMFSNQCAYRSNSFARNGAGVAVMYSREVEMERNDFDSNRGPTAYGLLLKDISDSRLDANRFSGNTVALHIEGGGRLTVSRNRFAGNGWAIRMMANSPENRFERNIFAGNSFDFSTNSRATSAIVSGNWWDRYKGYDLDRNGRGDVAFRPVRLFSLLVAGHPSSMILMRSTFVDLLDAAERALPILTPETLVDTSPLMVIPR